jgi:hypothetical protein
MDHAQLTTADYAQIDAEKARKEAHELSLKIDALANILGVDPEKLVEHGRLIKERNRLIKEENDRKIKEKEEAEFLSSGLTQEEWVNKRFMEMNIKNMNMVSAVDITEAKHLRGYNPFKETTFTALTDALLGLTK